jgi:hypothetical protein
MCTNPYLAERIMKERVNDALRRAEHERLLREVEEPRKAHGWWKSALLALSSLLGLIAASLS